MESDMVSWLPPKHPKASPSEPAAKLREKLLNPNSPIEMSESISRNEEEKDDKPKSLKNKEREKDEKRGKYDEKDRARKKLRKDDIDPMDPAAYSDIPQVSNGCNAERSLLLRLFP